MTNKEERPAGCVLRLFGAPEQTVQKAVEALPDTWQGTVHCRSRGAETLVALQSSTPQQLHRAVQQLRTSLALALYGEGEQTLAAAAVQALEQHRKLLVCSDTAAGALLETRLENLPGAEKVFDFGAMSYANTALTARLSRKLRKAPQAEPARTLARVQVMQKLTGAALTVGCVELPQSRLLLVGGKKGCWLRCLAQLAAAPGGERGIGELIAPEQSASPRPKRRRLGKALVVLLLLALAALAAGWYYTGGDLAALPQKLQSLGAESLPHAGARLV